eukprot:g7922.t1
MARPMGYNEDPLNDSISKLAFEAIREVDRIAAAGGLQKESVKRTIWTVLGLFRDIVREHTNNSTQKTEQIGPQIPQKLTYEEIQKSIRLNESILSVFAAASKELNALGPQPRATMIKPILTGKPWLIKAYQQMLELHGEFMNQVNFATMLHRVATLVSEASHQFWLLQEHPEFVHSLLDKLEEIWDRFDGQTYPSIMWSFGKLGPAMRSLMIKNRPYDVFIQDMLERSRHHFSSMTERDILNLLLGVSYSGVSPVILKPFLRAFSKVVMMKCDALRPRDLCSLSVCCSRLNYRQDIALLDRICDATEAQIQSFTPNELASFVRGIAFLEHPMSLSLRTKIMEHLESKMDEYSLADMIRVFHGMILVSHYPEQKALDHLCYRFEHVSDLKELEANFVSSFLLVLASVGHQRIDSITVCKRHFVENPTLYNPSTTTKFLWCLCVLDQLDDLVLKGVEKTTFVSLPVSQRTLEHRRTLCKIFIYLRIIQKKDLPQFVTRELEEACYSAWRAALRYQSPFGAIDEGFAILGDVGLDCKEALLLEKIPLRASTAILPAGQFGIEEDLKLVVEIITRSQLFKNNDSVNSLQCRWRQMILEALDWKVIHIRVPEWNRISSQNQKAQYLSKSIYEKTGVKVSQLDDFGKELKNVVEAIPAKLEEEEKQLTNNSDLYQSITADGEKLKLEPDLLLDDQEDGRFQNLVSTKSTSQAQKPPRFEEEILTEAEDVLTTSSESDEFDEGISTSTTAKSLDSTFSEALLADEAEHGLASSTDSDLSDDISDSTDDDEEKEERYNESILDTALAEGVSSEAANEMTSGSQGEDDINMDELLISDNDDETQGHDRRSTH